MKKILASIAATAAMLTVSTVSAEACVQPTTSTCSAPGSVTVKEWSKIEVGMPRWKVENIFDTHGCVVDKGRTHLVYVEYRPARGNSTYEVSYEYDPNVDRLFVLRYREFFA